MSASSTRGPTDQLQDLEGRSIIVTGAGSGIGRACAQTLASKGAKLGLLDLSEEALEDVQAGIRNGGGNAIAVTCDVGIKSEAENSISEIRSHLGAIDGLVAAAGVSRHGLPRPLHETDEQDWKAVIDTNLMGLVNVAREVLGDMQMRRTGTVVTFGSTYGFLAGPKLGPYSASKAAIVQVTRSIAYDYGRYGVRANTIVPGWIDTPLLRTDAALSGEFDDVMAPIKTRSLLARLGTPSEIADVCLFLTSNQSSFITGSVVVADGGYSVS